MEETFLDVRGTRTHLQTEGTGEPLLYFHGAGGSAWAPGLTLLAQQFRVIAPTHPGFGQSDDRPEWDRLDDYVYHYLDLLDALGLERVHLVGSSLGGWLAAEMAVAQGHRLRSLVLIDAAGLWLDEAPMVDLFYRSQAELLPLMWADPSKAPKPPPATPETMLAQAKNQTTVARLAWKPYFHNPKLPGRLARLTVPTLILWGANDGLIPPAHGRRYQELIPNAELQLIPECGHVVLREQAESSAAAIKDFITRRAS